MSGVDYFREKQTVRKKKQIKSSSFNSGPNSEFSASLTIHVTCKWENNTASENEFIETKTRKSRTYILKEKYYNNKQVRIIDSSPN